MRLSRRHVPIDACPQLQQRFGRDGLGLAVTEQRPVPLPCPWPIIAAMVLFRPSNTVRLALLLTQRHCARVAIADAAGEVARPRQRWSEAVRMAIPGLVELDSSGDLHGPHCGHAIDHDAWAELDALEACRSHGHGRAPGPGPTMQVTVARKPIVSHVMPAVC